MSEETQVGQQLVVELLTRLGLTEKVSPKTAENISALVPPQGGINVWICSEYFRANPRCRKLMALISERHQALGGKATFVRPPQGQAYLRLT